MVQVPKSILITGANRGIGLGLVREYLKKEAVAHVFATARDPDNASDLTEISDSRLTVVKMDVRCDDSIKSAYTQVSRVLGNAGLNLLINNAGVLLSYHLHEDPNRQKIEDTMTANIVGPVLVSHYFLPLLRQAEEANPGWGVAHGAVINISSDLASIGGCPIIGSTPKGFLPYKISKAGLNQFGKCLSQDLKKESILVANFHPGWVATDMGGQEAPVTVEECATNLVESFSVLNEQHTGGYFNNKGEAMPF